MGGAPPLSVGPRLLTHVWQGGAVPSKPPHTLEPPGGQGAHVHPPGWTAVLERTLPHFVKGPPGTRLSAKWVRKEPPFSPEGPKRGRMIRRRASGRAVPSPGALRRTTLKRKYVI